MPFPAIALGAVSAIGGIMQAKSASKAAGKAAAAQTAAAEAGIAEQRRQFDTIRGLLAPYVSAGTKGLAGQMALMGLSGNDAQAAAIQNIQNGPQFGSMVKTGEDAILANASATGGLRGGNTQSALAQFRPQILSQLINQQMQNLGGLSSIGQNSAAGTGNAASAMGNNITDLLAQQGAAQAGGALGQGQAASNLWGGIAAGAGNLLGQLGGGGFGLGGGATSGVGTVGSLFPSTRF